MFQPATPQTFKVVRTIALEDGAGLDQLAEALMLLSDMAFDLDWIGTNAESVAMVKLIRVEPEKQPDQAFEIEAEETEPDQTENQSEQDEETHPSSSSKPKFRQFNQGTILPRPPSRPPPAILMAEQTNRESAQEETFYQRLQPKTAFNVFKEGAQSDDEDPEAASSRQSSDIERRDSSWQSSGWNWKKRSNTECHVCKKVRSEHQNKKFCNMSWR